jgi:hypothetical protein
VNWNPPVAAEPAAGDGLGSTGGPIRDAAGLGDTGGGILSLLLSVESNVGVAHRREDAAAARAAGLGT